MNDIIASPSVRALAAERGINIEKRARQLGRTTITRDDLQASAPAALATDVSYWDVDHAQYGPIEYQKMGKIDMLAAKNLAAANTFIPSVTHHDEVGIDAIEAFRKSLENEAMFRGVKLTSLAFFVIALARALRDFSKFNASLSPNGSELILKQYVHIGVAVDTDYGLVVPVIRDADQKGIWQIAAEITDLASRAQKRKIRPEEMGGASMSISNLGGIGGTGFTPIVNPPEVAILGITRAKTATEWQNGEPRPVLKVPIDLSYDHRVINGADAANFCVQIGKYITDPRMLIL